VCTLFVGGVKGVEGGGVASDSGNCGYMWTALLDTGHLQCVKMHLWCGEATLMNADLQGGG